MTTSTEHRPPVGRGRPARRRLSAAGNVLLTTLVALMVGWVLNAPGILKTAEGMPLGWRRDVAVAFAKPVASVSSFFQLDRPRAWIQDVIDREGEDEIEVALPSPTTVSPNAPSTSTTTTRPSQKPAFTPQNPLRTWIGGDSLAVTPGQSLIPRLDATGAATIVAPVDGQVASGLARPEVFNWPQFLMEVIAAHNPRAMVLTLGVNDDQPLTNAPGGGTVGSVGSQPWQDEYRRRVGGLMDAVAVDGRVLFWVGVPIIRDTDRYFRGYDFINKIVAEEAAKRRGRVYFVETYTPLTDDGGGYVDYLPNPGGELVQIRAGDGIHFTRAGGNIVADEIMAKIDDAFDLESWRAPPPSTTTTKPQRTTTTTTTTTTRPRSAP